MPNAASDFYRYDAMRKRGLHRRPMSVCLSICHVGPSILSTRLMIII